MNIRCQTCHDRGDPEREDGCSTCKRRKPSDAFQQAFQAEAARADRAWEQLRASRRGGHGSHRFDPVGIDRFCWNDDCYQTPHDDPHECPRRLASDRYRGAPKTVRVSLGPVKPREHESIVADLKFKSMTLLEWLHSLPDGTQLRVFKGGILSLHAPGEVYLVDYQVTP